jgi:hypothetical protein
VLARRVVIAIGCGVGLVAFGVLMTRPLPVPPPPLPAAAAAKPVVAAMLPTQPVRWVERKDDIDVWTFYVTIAEDDESAYGELIYELKKFSDGDRQQFRNVASPRLQERGHMSHMIEKMLRIRDDLRMAAKQAKRRESSGGHGRPSRRSGSSPSFR